MSNVAAFSLDKLHLPTQDDIQLKLLNNALARFCDELEMDSCRLDEARSLATRLVIWRFGRYRFRAKLVTFDNETSLGIYDYAEDGPWQRLTTPRALAEKLTQAL